MGIWLSFIGEQAPLTASWPIFSRNVFRVCLGGISNAYLRAYFSDFEMSFDLSPKRIMGPFYLSPFPWTLGSICAF